MTLVLDASAAGPILIADESQALIPGLNDALASERAMVPPHWHLEIGNLLLVARRCNRLSDLDLSKALSTLRALDVAPDDRASAFPNGPIWTLARRHELTIYDAAYLELAQRLQAPLATSDSALRKAATDVGVALFGQ